MLEELQECKGMRTYTPFEYLSLSFIEKAWVKAAKSYGFQMYKPPILEPLKLYEDKTSQDIFSKEIYSFSDKGGREVALRPELTPSLGRMVTKLQKARVFKKPFKVFAIGSCFRYENPQKARKREFIQFNADILGENSPWAVAEIIMVTVKSLEYIGLTPDDFSIKVNDRQITQSRLLREGLTPKEIENILKILDKSSKISKSELDESLKEIREDLSEEKLDDILDEIPSSIHSLRDFVDEEYKILYAPDIVRGFDYYTGVVFEIYANNSAIKRAIAGGGQYDNLVEELEGEPTPAVGVGIAEAALLEILLEKNIEIKRDSEILAIVAETEKDLAEAYKVSSNLRDIFVNNDEEKNLKKIIKDKINSIRCGKVTSNVSFMGVMQKNAKSFYEFLERINAKNLVIVNDKVVSVKNLETQKAKSFKTKDPILEDKIINSI